METNKIFKQQIDELTENSGKREVFRKLSFKKEWNIFSVKNKKVYFVHEAGAGFDKDSNDVFINKVKLILKKKPWIFSTIYHFMNPSFAKWRASRVLKNLSNNSVVLNLGS